MSDDLHAACDSRILALESALRIANAERDQFRDDIAHATFALMPDTATGIVEADDLVPMIRGLKAERDRLRAVVEAARVWLDNGGLYSVDLVEAVRALEARDGLAAFDQQEAT